MKLIATALGLSALCVAFKATADTATPPAAPKEACDFIDTTDVGDALGWQSVKLSVFVRMGSPGSDSPWGVCAVSDGVSIPNPGWDAAPRFFFGMSLSPDGYQSQFDTALREGTEKFQCKDRDTWVRVDDIGDFSVWTAGGRALRWGFRDGVAMGLADTRSKVPLDDAALFDAFSRLARQICERACSP